MHYIITTNKAYTTKRNTVAIVAMPSSEGSW